VSYREVARDKTDSLYLKTAGLRAGMECQASTCDCLHFDEILSPDRVIRLPSEQNQLLYEGGIKVINRSD
jgi:hypothetical protein